MKARIISLSVAVACTMSVSAYDIVWMNLSSGLSAGLEPATFAKITYSADKSYVILSGEDDSKIGQIPTAELLDITFGDTDGSMLLDFNQESPRFYCPEYFSKPDIYKDLDITCNGDHVAITVGASLEQLDQFALKASGSTADGQIKVYASMPVTINLDKLFVANQQGSAINIQSKKITTINIVGDSQISDSQVYVTPDGEKEKGALYSLGSLIIDGSASLDVTGNYKHAVCAEKALTFKSGTVNVLSSASDGLHSAGFEMQGGKYTCSKFLGDAVDADTETILVSGGEISIEATEPDVKGLKADGNITFEGGDFSLIMSSDQGKGIKSKADIIVNAGALKINTSGNAVVVDGDPSYCSAIKADANFSMTGGSIEISSSGKGGKGISCDLDAIFTGGSVIIDCTGDGEVYTDVNNNYDSYCSTCITSDTNIFLLSGTFNLTNNGSAGKCIKADGEIILGDESNLLNLTATTSGIRIKEGDATSTGPTTGGNRPGGWGPGGGGFDQNADYANPKVVKAVGNLTVNGGIIKIKSSNEGGEGLESKKVMTINGGEIDIVTSDDAINATSQIVINGGKMRCQATNNDAIDSNGTLTINGGIVIAIGTKTPECGFDCDNNRFAINGGVVIGLGGDTSTPTSSACTQKVVIYQASFSNGSLYTVTDPSGAQIVSFKSPLSVSGKMVISSPGISASGSYSIYTGGTITGGETFAELTTGAQYAPGTLAKTFSPTSMVISVR